ncbi:DUF3318 domain-containing protein [Frigoribacterium faeni]|uniref:DUF3318 domain-containing protein n=1 Tax=Frigoribacterium faeni TaxID=145483 RepID=UPI001FAE2FEB|nr:DUF3318 domain-containing protein [Frigoribacterium faeni]MCJ0700241.1 DUF3318 domain-containing protein [Frigoribacterium faeni]
MQPKKKNTLGRDGHPIQKNGLFKHVDEPDDFSAQVSKYLLQSKDDRTRILHELRVRVQKNDAKNKSSFRSAAIAVLSVFLAIAGVIIVPGVNAMRWDDTSPANVAQLETAMNEDFAAFQAYSWQLTADKRNYPLTPAKSREVQVLSNRADLSRSAYYDKLQASFRDQALGLFSVIAGVLAALAIWLLWRKLNRDADKADIKRALAAAWLDTYTAAASTPSAWNGRVSAGRLTFRITAESGESSRIRGPLVAKG